MLSENSDSVVLRVYRKQQIRKARPEQDRRVHEIIRDAIMRLGAIRLRQTYRRLSDDRTI